jgi:tetratricopeptide (TPR) repeat protein
MGCATSSLAQNSAAREHFDRALSYHDPERHVNLLTAVGADPGILALTYLGFTLAELGFLEQGFAAAQRAFSLGRARPHSFSMAWGLQAMTNAYLRRGAMKEALETADALVNLSKEQGFAQWLAHGMVFRATALSWLESPARAIPLLQEALAFRLATAARISRPAFSLNLVSAYLRGGEFTAGLALVEELLEEIERTNDRQVESQLWRFRGALLLALGKSDDAEVAHCLEKAIVVARHQEAKFFELLSATDLARLWHRRGKREAARDLLEPIYAWFTEGFDWPDLRSARALLDELEKPEGYRQPGRAS